LWGIFALGALQTVFQRTHLRLRDDDFVFHAAGDAGDFFGDLGVEIALLLHDDFGATCGQANEVESETGIERVAQRAEPLGKQPVDHRSPGHGLSGIDHDGANRAVGAEKTGFQPPRTLALLRHCRDQHRRQRG